MRIIIKIGNGQSSAPVRATSPERQRQAGRLLPQPQVASVTFRCSAPLRRPHRAQPARNHLPFVGRVGGTGRARAGNQRAKEASPSRSVHRPGSRGSGRPSAGAGRVLTGRLPNLPATDPPAIGAATGRVRSCPLSCVQKTEPRPPAEEL